MKRVIKLVLCLLLVLTLSFQPNVFATSSSDSDDMAVISTKVSEMIPLIYEDAFLGQRFFIGERFQEYRVTGAGELENSDYETYPLMSDNVILGIIKVSRDSLGDISQVTLGVDYSDELQALLNSNNSNDGFAVIQTESGACLKFESSDTLHSLNAYNDYAYLELTSVQGVDYSTLTNSGCFEIEPSVSRAVVRSTSGDTLHKILSVENVSNTSTTCCPEGICWAASIAIMANYHCGTSYTALQVHDLCGCFSEDGDYHDEEKAYIRQLGMYAAGPYESDGNYPFCFSTLADCINADMLLLLDLQDYSADCAHNVVAYGYFATSSPAATYFYYIDPNTGRNVSSFPAVVGDTVTISLGGYNYQVHCYITAD